MSLRSFLTPSGQPRLVNPVEFDAIPRTAAYDGTVVSLLVDDTIGCIWNMRYRHASTRQYKWEFLGGVPLYAEVQIMDTMNNNPAAYARITGGTVGPTVVVPITGVYQFTFGGWLSAPTTGSARMGVFYATTGVDDNEAVHQNNGRAVSVSRQIFATVAANFSAEARYQATAASSTDGALFARRFLSAIPLRLA